LQVDPVPGGGENAYVYPSDPVNGNDYSGCVFTSDAFDQSRSASWDGGGDAQASMRAMVQTVMRRLDSANRKSAAFWGTCSSIAGLVSLIPRVGPVAEPIAIGTGLLSAYYTCTIDSASADCALSFSSMAAWGIAKYWYREIQINYQFDLNGYNRAKQQVQGIELTYGLFELRQNSQNYSQ
jgi:hypothetical protein